MVCRDEEGIARLLARLVHDLEGLDHSIQYPRVANHVWGREVPHHELVLLLAHELRHLLREAFHAHLRVLAIVVRRDLRRRDDIPLLVVER